MKQLLLTLFLSVCAWPHEAVHAQTLMASAAADSVAVGEPIVTHRQWLWGIGRANLLDTYLSPLEYAGTNLTLLHQTRRPARWGRGRVLTVSTYSLQGAYVASPTDDGKEWDAELSASGGWLYSFVDNRRWTVAVGGQLEGSSGFTYNTRGQNNPAQGRLGAALLASGLTEYRFPLFRRTASVALQLDAQLLGAQFSPEYGQSYYEIFSLGHSDGVVHLTHLGNCPSARLLTAVTLPVWGAKVTLGYMADVRQSRLGGLKRHAWRNTFMVGYTRSLRLVR